jgi:FkbM family methyltransferase
MKKCQCSESAISAELSSMNSRIVLILVWTLFIYLMYMITLFYGTPIHSSGSTYQQNVNKSTFSNLKWGENHIELDDLRTCLTLGTARDMKFFQNRHINKYKHTYLKNSSILVEVGGNIGDDSAFYIRLYNPFLIIFEPIPSLCKRLSDRFMRNPKVEIYCYGIGDRNKTVFIELSGGHGEGSSLFKNYTATSSATPVVIVTVGHAIKYILAKTQRKMIDLLSINCEGCEYEIIFSLIDSGTIKLVRNLQFQTHYGLIKHDVYYYCIIQQLLNLTHANTYRYHAVWESWTLRKL